MQFIPTESALILLPGGEVVDTNQLEFEIRKICHYVEYVVICLKDGELPVAMIFPNRKLLANPDYEKSPEEGCFCPRNLTELGRCLTGCMNTMNNLLMKGSAKVYSAIIINSPLSVEDGTLTPALKTNAEIILEKYGNHLKNLFGGNFPVSEESFKMKL